MTAGTYLSTERNPDGSYAFRCVQLASDRRTDVPKQCRHRRVREALGHAQNPSPLRSDPSLEPASRWEQDHGTAAAVARTGLAPSEAPVHPTPVAGPPAIPPEAEFLDASPVTGFGF